MGLKKYQPELGMMKESGAGQYVKLYDYRDLEKKFFDSNARIAELEKQLEKAESVIALYAEKDHWSLENATRCSSFVYGDHEFLQEEAGFRAGAKAREYFADKETK